MDDFLTGLIVDLAPACVVAAGHAAGYALRHAARDPAVALPHVLVEPTWRGPTAMIPPRRSRRPQLSCPAVTMHKR